MNEPQSHGAAEHGLSPADVERAFDRMTARDAERGRDARHIYDTLTWGEGPGVLSQAGVQDWLWYRLPTKYMTNEADYKQRLAGIAGELFDELGLGRYAAICRSDTTARVHAAFDRSNSAGYSAMRKALSASGIDPPDIDGFAWSSVMGSEEAAVRSDAERALEAAIDDGRLRVGARAWRDTQAAVVAGVLDADHPTLPGQSLRTAVHTERAESWRDLFARRSPTFVPVVDQALKQSLATPDPPAADAIAAALHPLLWLLERVGDTGQAMTQAGYLNRPFVVEVWKQRPWTDELLPLDKPPRSESDDFILHSLRTFAQHAGLVRITKRVLRRTELGDRALADPLAAWQAVVARLGGTAWERFIVETAATLFVVSRGTIAARSLVDTISQVAGELGWRTDERLPSDHDVSFGFGETRRLLLVLGMLTEHGDWRDRTYVLTSLGTQLVTAIVHSAATGPRTHP
jgi:hypothetical protein